MEETAGIVIGRYEVMNLLGKGGAAMVYRARDTALDRQVALKLILPEQDHTDRFLKRFQREARALAQLSHPSIVKILDYGETQGKPYLVTEYMAGGMLSSRMGKPMPPSEAAGLLLPVARALAYAHQRHIIHRDVKPSNILLNESGQPMLSDFGIVKLTENDESQSLTGTGAMVGTPSYMSPEQIQGRPVDARTDVYALTVVFFEMVTGQRPYNAPTPIEVTVKHLKDPIPRARQLVRDLPAEVEQALMKGLAKKPEDRFQDMNAFAAVLEKLAAGKKGRAATTARASSPGSTGSGASPEGVTPPAGLPIDEQATRDDQAAPQSPAAAQAPARRSIPKLAWVGGIIVLLVMAGLGAWQPWNLSSVTSIATQPVAVAAAARVSSPTPTPEPTRTKPAGTPTSVPSPTPEASATLEPSPEASPEALAPTATAVTNRISTKNIAQVSDLNRLDKVSIIALDWTKDSRWVVVAGSKFITVIDPTTMKVDRVISLGNNISKTSALAPDSRLVYVLVGNRVQVFDLETRQETASFNVQNGANSLAISPDGTTLAVGTADNKVFLLNAADGVVKRMLKSNYGGWAVAFSPDGTRVAAATSQGVLMWQVETGTIVRLKGEQNTPFHSLAFSANGSYLAAGTDGRIVVWTLANGESSDLVAPKAHEMTQVNTMAFTPDNLLLVSGSEDGRVRVWDLTEAVSPQRLVAEWEKHQSAVYGVCVSPDGRFVVSGANEGILYKWGAP